MATLLKKKKKKGEVVKQKLEAGLNGCKIN